MALYIASSQLELKDFYSPAHFDAIKNDLDQDAFYSLFENHSTDAIMRCRKAELLIQLESDDEALALLADNPSLLARGLKAKIFASQKKLEEVIALCDVVYQGIDPIELEGLVHLLEMSMWTFYMRSDYHAALIKCSQAEDVARALGVAGRLKILSSQREVLQGKIGLVSTEALEQSGNTFTNQHQLITRWRSLMVAGHFDQAANLSVEPAMSNLARSTQYYLDGSIYRAASNIFKALPTLAEFKMYQALLTLQIYVKCQDPLYANPKTALTLLKDLSILPQMLEEALQLYPLGICLAASQIPAFEGACRLVPKLKHKAYRDGVWIDGKLVCVLPNDVRKAAIYDSLNPGENAMQSVRRQYRHIAARSLTKAKLDYRHIATQPEINRDTSRLSEFLMR